MLGSSNKPNTHRRRRRDETVLSRRVGVGGVYWAIDGIETATPVEPSKHMLFEVT